MQAYIGRIEHLTDEHWHGKLASVISFAGCDFNCPNCNTPGILSAKDEFLIDLKEVKKEIKEHIGQIETVIFTGGEPTLQRQALITLAAYAKDAKLKTALITNGSKTECIRSLLRLNLIDYIALDIKAPFEEELFEKATRSKTFFKTTKDLMKDVKDTLKLLKEHENKIDIAIRTTITPTLVSRKEELNKIAEMIEGIECVWEIKRFSPENVTNKRFSDIKTPSGEFIGNLIETINKRFPNIRVHSV